MTRIFQVNLGAGKMAVQRKVLAAMPDCLNWIPRFYIERTNLDKLLSDLHTHTQINNCLDGGSGCPVSHRATNLIPVL